MCKLKFEIIRLKRGTSKFSPYENFEVPIISILLADLSRTRSPLDTIAEAASQDESNLTAGLRLAAGLAPSTGIQELLIISDGLYTGSDPLLEVPVLRKRGVRVHYLALDLRRHNDVAVSRLLTPSRSAVNQAFNIAAEIVSPARQPAICAKLRRISLNLLEKINLMI